MQRDLDSLRYASPEINENEPDTAYFLVLSGGAFRGAFQFWVIVHLMCRFWFAHIGGVSIGAGNGTYAAMHKLDKLWALWNSVDGFRGFLRLRVMYLLGWLTGWVFILNKLGARIVPGAYSMMPYVDKLTEDVKLQDVKVPLSVGVVAAQGGTEIYYNIDSTDCDSDEEFISAIQGSGCMVPFMAPPLIDLPQTKSKVQEIVADGGYWNIFPIPRVEIQKARAQGKKVVIKAVGCTPLDRVKRVRRKKVFGLVSLTLRLIEIMEAAVYDGDILQLRFAAGRGGEVHLYVPAVAPGDSFDASPQQIQRRLAESAEMVKRGPIVYPGIGE